MNKEFVTPILEVIELGREDIICTSGINLGTGSGSEYDEQDI